jgi:SAM-dependent methyltransferase
MRPVQAWARQRRIRFFLPYLRPGDRVLEIGPGDGWFRRAVEAVLPVRYLTIDLRAPADIRGDIRDWKRHGLVAGSFDAIVAFEVVEHTPCLAECHELLKPGGRLFVTTPMPKFDRLLKIMESLHLAQKRTSEHTHLVLLNSIPGFAIERGRRPWGVGQWVVLRKSERSIHAND